MLDFLTPGPKFVAHVSYASDELHRPPMHGFAAACNLLLLSMLSQDKQTVDGHGTVLICLTIHSPHNKAIKDIRLHHSCTKSVLASHLEHMSHSCRHYNANMTSYAKPELSACQATGNMHGKLVKSTGSWEKWCQRTSNDNSNRFYRPFQVPKSKATGNKWQLQPQYILYYPVSNKTGNSVAYPITYLLTHLHLRYVFTIFDAT